MNPGIITPRLGTDGALCARRVVVRGDGEIDVVEINLPIGIAVGFTNSDRSNRKWRKGGRGKDQGGGDVAKEAEETECGPHNWRRYGDEL